MARPGVSGRGWLTGTAGSDDAQPPYATTASLIVGTRGSHPVDSLEARCRTPRIGGGERFPLSLDPIDGSGPHLEALNLSAGIDGLDVEILRSR